MYLCYFETFVILYYFETFVIYILGLYFIAFNFLYLFSFLDNLVIMRSFNRIS
ncbi:hypothetical protein Hanom_Chr15g01384731 [Helianthus anomalus]